MYQVITHRDPYLQRINVILIFVNTLTITNYQFAKFRNYFLLKTPIFFQILSAIKNVFLTERVKTVQNNNNRISAEKLC